MQHMTVAKAVASKTVSPFRSSSKITVSSQLAWGKYFTKGPIRTFRITRFVVRIQLLTKDDVALTDYPICMHKSPSSIHGHGVRQIPKAVFSKQALTHHQRTMAQLLRHPGLRTTLTTMKCQKGLWPNMPWTTFTTCPMPPFRMLLVAPFSWFVS